MGYTQERQTLVDYSHPIGDFASHWISKPPEKLHPSTNIVRVFDYNWLKSEGRDYSVLMMTHELFFFTMTF